MSTLPQAEPILWQVEDVRGICIVTSVGGQLVVSRCGFCGQRFEAAGWVRVSVARPHLGGSVTELCSDCSAAHWESIATHLAVVSEQLRLADAFRSQLGL